MILLLIIILLILYFVYRKKKKVSDNSSLENKTAPQTEVAPQKKYHVAGTSFHKKDIISLGFEDNEFSETAKELCSYYSEGDKIYKYKFFNPYNVELIPEPTNPHDPNAIKVVISGIHVGYIKKGSISTIKKAIQNGDTFTAEIVGGDYKEIYEDDNLNLKVHKESTDFGILLTRKQASLK